MPGGILLGHLRGSPAVSGSFGHLPLLRHGGNQRSLASFTVRDRTGPGQIHRPGPVTGSGGQEAPAPACFIIAAMSTVSEAGGTWTFTGVP